MQSKLGLIGKARAWLRTKRTRLGYRFYDHPAARRLRFIRAKEGPGDLCLGEKELLELARWGSQRATEARVSELSEKGSLHVVRVVAAAKLKKIGAAAKVGSPIAKGMPTKASSIPSLDNRQVAAEVLFASIKERIAELRALALRMHGSAAQDGVYRYFHQSFKVYGRLQPMTEEIVTVLQSLAPALPLASLLAIPVARGTGMKFEMSHNDDWTWRALAITQGFLLSREVLDCVIRSVEGIEAAPKGVLPTDWATVLELYGIR